MIQWSRDSSIITSLDDSSSVPSSFISKDETWTVTVTPSDGTDFGSPVSSVPIIVQNTPPVVNGLTISPTDPTELDDLMMSYSFSDSDLDTESGTVIQWYLDGSRVSTYDGASTIPNVSTRAGDIWEVRITF